MTKSNTIYECSKCGAQSSKWIGRCVECGGWGTVELIAGEKKETAAKLPPVKLTGLGQIEAAKFPRILTGIDEVNRVLGGGIVPGSLILLGGEPGIGKSTLILQIADGVAKKNPVLYVSGEESAEQVKLRFDRLGIKNNQINFLGETDLETITAAIHEHKPALAIIDSIQTIRSSNLESETGAVSQIRAVTVKLLETAKKTGTPIIIIGHITKDGSLAGPKTLEHLVDTVLYLEGDANNFYRLLRGFKNRFGSTDEIGVFEMTSGGMKEVANPSAALLEELSENPGAIIAATMEGNRPLLLEIQALVNRTAFGYPNRRAVGFDQNRLSLLIAVLTRRAKIDLGSFDVYLNIVGGLDVDDPGTDLAAAAAIISSFLDKPAPPKTIFIGEIGLSGEVRRTKTLEKRLDEAKKLGLKKAVIPKSKNKISSSLELVEIDNIIELAKLFR